MSRILVSFFFTGMLFLVQAQDRYTLSGIVTEASSNETLIGVTITIKELKTGATTNEYGFYSITLPTGDYEIQVGYLGFKEIIQRISLTKNLRLNFEMEDRTEELGEVVITGSSESYSLGKTQMSVSSLTAQKIKQIPVVLGEADVVKSILLLPGVTNAGEASSGFNVRGGAADQNLIQLDEATIFNSSHLFGFFSVFNPDAIKDVKLFKGGIPARYGGRVSSVLDVFQKEGNSREFKMNGGIGAVSSRLLAEGPIVKDKAAFLIGGRSSYAHFLLPLFDIDNFAYFYDVNTKLNYRLDDHNNFYLSGYFGKDVFSINDSFVNDYGNALVNFRWNHLFSDKLFSNLSVIYSDYFSGLELDFEGFKWSTGIKNFNLKYDLKHYLNDKLQVNYGVHNAYYRFNPGTIEPSNLESGVTSDQLTEKFANESAAYLDIEHDVTNKLSLGYGLRFSYFIRFAQDDIFAYKDDNPIIFDPFTLVYSPAIPADTVNLDDRQILDQFANIEPRLSIGYQFTQKTAVKLSYTRMSQYLHLLSNTNSPTPVDVWTPSGRYVKPQLLDQFALGFFQKLKNGFSVESEWFYKEIQNRIDYIDGADLIANNAIEQVILNGEARAFGWELLLKKETGKFKGWIAYTLSKSEQRTPGRIPKRDNGRSNREIGINLGEWYKTPYDKTHDVAVNFSYEMSDKWTFNSNFIYQTGQPTNYPIGQFEFQGLVIPYYGQRNVERLPDYHRFDVSATLTPLRNKGRALQGEWIFSLYNVYNRMNASSINFQRNSETGVNEAVRTSIFGLVPSVTYNFKL